MAGTLKVLLNFLMSVRNVIHVFFLSPLLYSCRDEVSKLKMHNFYGKLWERVKISIYFRYFQLLGLVQMLMAKTTFS